MSGRDRILVSAYACEPAAGSEPGIGWHTVVQLARVFDVWVVTRESNRAEIERELQVKPNPHLHFVYGDLPGWLRWWKRGGRGVQLYYYLWQLWIFSTVRRLHRKLRFAAVQHITFGRYWMPSLLAFVAVPFLWGPVGGGDSVPSSLRTALSPRGRIQNRIRHVVRWVGEHDPLVRTTARRCRVALAATPATADRLRALGAHDVRLLPATAMPGSEIEKLGRASLESDDPFRFLSIGNLIYWKAFNLGLQAFAEAAIRGAEYVVIGDGPELRRLKALSRSLGIADKVRWLGRQPRKVVLDQYARCHVLVHPSLHDSGGWVCLEAMAAGRPVICLDLAGPAVLVTDRAGIRVRPHTEAEVVVELASAMSYLAATPGTRARMGSAGREHVFQQHHWDSRGAALKTIYSDLLSTPGRVPVP